MLSTRDTHNHPSNPAELEFEKVIASIKRKTMQTAQPIPALYLNEVHQVSVCWFGFSCQNVGLESSKGHIICIVCRHCSFSDFLAVNQNNSTPGCQQT